MKKIYIFLLILLFISPILFVESANKVIYVIMASLIGYSISNELSNLLKEKSKYKSSEIFFLFLIILLYSFIFFILNNSYYSDTLSLLMWMMLGTWVAYGGVSSIRKKYVKLRGFVFKGISAIIWGLLAIGFSIFILIMKRII